MAPISIPIRLRFLRFPVLWSLQKAIRKTFADPRLAGMPGREVDFAIPKMLYRVGQKTDELDTWTCRDEFFKLKSDADLLGFLNKTGLWFADETIAGLAKEWHLTSQNGVFPIAVTDIWTFRERIRGMLLQRTFSSSAYLDFANTGFSVPCGDFPVHYETSSVASGEIIVTQTLQALLATVFIDVARGIKFKVCARKDCKKPFPLESKHKRKFCSQYCGHLVSQRDKREIERKKRDKVRRTGARKSLHVKRHT